MQSRYFVQGALGAAVLLAIALSFFITKQSNPASHGTHVTQRLLADVGMLKCTPQQAVSQADRFPATEFIQSACAPHMWMEQMQAQRPHGKHILIDIGCNKGYHVAESLDLYAPELGVNQPRMRTALGEVQKQLNLTSEMCGACGCSGLRASPVGGGPREVVIHCFEPSDRNYGLLLHGRQQLFTGSLSAPRQPGPLTLQRGTSSATWHIYNMAVSNFSGSAAFSSSCDTELCHLESGPSGAAAGQYTVQVVTVDEVMKRWVGHNRVSLLKVDTEGYDPDVLRGAENTFSSQAVDLVIFEYHGIGRWKDETLAGIVVWMEAKGYACYFEGNPFIYKLSRGCWNPKYEIKTWSNVVCGRAGDWPEMLLDSRSYLRQMTAQQ
ncbi:S-adenosyl-L-methionine-dependent methyltransferase [Haematococcus lacustris]